MDIPISKLSGSQTLCSFLQAGDFILAENIKLIDVIKEINFRKNKLLIGVTEKFEDERKTEADQFRGLVRPVSQTLSRVA